MKHYVLLIQVGIVAQVHPVCGKSGRCFGNATQSPEHRGVVFQMSEEDYNKDSLDLIGNRNAGQQWVPKFVTEQTTEEKPQSCSSPQCNLGPGQQKAPASYRYGDQYFCPAHAPFNAEPLHAGVPPIGTGTAVGIAAMAPAPIVSEMSEKPVSSAALLPPASHDSPAFRDPGAAPADTVGGDELVASDEATIPPGAEVEEAPKSVAPLIQTMVAQTVEKAMAGMEERLGNALIAAVKASVKPKIAKVAQKRRVPTEPTPMQLVQAKAKEMGIPIFGKSKAWLEAEIDNKGNGQHKIEVPMASSDATETPGFLGDE